MSDTAVTPEVLIFDYNSIPDDSREVARAVALDIKPRLRRAAEDVIAVGRGLIRVKAALPHGFFGRWAYDEFGLTVKTTERFVDVAQLAERMGAESDNLSHLLPSVLYLLAQRTTPPAAVGEIIRLNTELRAQGERGATVAQTQEVIRRLRPSVPDIDDAEELPELRPAGASGTVPLRRVGDELPTATRRTGDSMAATHSTATCRACHRPLTDPASALAGIGPCCALREQMAGGTDGTTAPGASATGIDGNWQSLTDEIPVYSLSDDDVDIDDAPTHTAALTAVQRSAARNLLRTIGYGINYFHPHPAAAEFGVEREWQTAWNAIQTLQSRLEAICQ